GGAHAPAIHVAQRGGARRSHRHESATRTRAIITPHCHRRIPHQQAASVKEFVMASTLVGLFDDRSAAESVRQELIDAGFDSSNIRLSEQETSETGTTVTKRKGRGFWAELRDFFGMEGRSQCEEARRRGSTIVAIDVADDQQLDNALDIMQRHNPVDLDRRILEWQQAGWQPQPAQPQTRAETTEESIPVVEE